MSNSVSTGQAMALPSTFPRGLHKRREQARGGWCPLFPPPLWLSPPSLKALKQGPDSTPGPRCGTLQGLVFEEMMMVNEPALSPTGRREKGLCAHNKDKNVSLPITACVTWTVFPSRFLSQSKFTSCKGSKVWSIHQVFNIYSREALPKLKKKKIFLITLFLISSFHSQRKGSQY